MAIEYRRQQQLRGSTTDWTNNNIVLLQGELGFEMISPGIWRMKVGDGTRTWSVLPYIGEVDQVARDANTLQDTEISNLDTRVTAIEGVSTDLTALQDQVNTNTTDIANKQDSLGTAPSSGNITFWNGLAWVATAMTLPHGGLYYWSTAIEDYVALTPGTVGQVLTWDTSGVPRWKAIPVSGGAVPEAPVDGVLYARRDLTWDPVPDTLPDAPADGEYYARKDEAWEIIPTPVADPPIDGKTYGRKDGAWVELVAAYDLYFDFGAAALTANAERAMVTVRTFTIPADLVGARVSTNGGDASAPVMTLYDDGVAIATLTLGVTGGTWAPVTPATSIVVEAGSLVVLRAPGTISAAFTAVRASVAATRN